VREHHLSHPLSINLHRLFSLIFISFDPSCGIVISGTEFTSFRKCLFPTEKMPGVRENLRLDHTLLKTWLGANGLVLI